MPSLRVPLDPLQGHAQVEKGCRRRCSAFEGSLLRHRAARPAPFCPWSGSVGRRPAHSARPSEAQDCRTGPHGSHAPRHF